MIPRPALPRLLRPGRLSLCCLSLLSLCRLSLLSLFFPRSQTQSWFPAWFTVLPRSGGLQSRMLRPGGLQSRLLRPGGLQSRLLRPGGSSPVCSALGGSRSVCSTLGAPVPSAPPWWAPGPSAPPWGVPVPSAPPRWAPGPSAPPWRAPVPSSPPWLPHGPGPPSLPLFRLRSTAHLVMCRSVWKPLLGGGYVTNPSHEHCSTHHQRSLSSSLDSHTVTDHPFRLHLPSFTAPSQLFHIISLHLFTIISSHTHYISPEHSATLCRVLLASLPTKRFP